MRTRGVYLFVLAAAVLVAIPAAAATTQVTYHGVPAAPTLIGSRPFSPQNLPKVVNPSQGPFQHRQMPYRTPGKPLSGKTNPGSPVLQASQSAIPAAKPATVLYNWNGLSNVDNGNLTGFIFEPPDQGLCVGYDQGQKYVIEMVNVTIGFYQPDGTLVSEDTFYDFFQDNSLIVSDPRCVYDKANNAFFFTVVGTDDATESHFDVAVLNGNTGVLTNYRFDDTDLSNPYGDCPCLGDQPHTGIDDNALYVSVDEFSLVQPLYNGASLYVLSKADLLNSGSVTAQVITNISLANIPILTLMPAISETSTTTEYLLNTFAYDQFGYPIAFTNQIGYWKVTGFPSITLTGNLETTETYAFPVYADTTPPGNVLNPNDDRISQVEYFNGQLWSCVETALHFKGSVSDVDGAAWFQLDSSNGKVQHQGYVGASGQFLIYPSVLRSFRASATVNFTITNPNLNPSTGFVNLNTPNVITITATGYSPYSTLFFRWGDYSASTLDPDGQVIWMANEYVPPPSFQTSVLNWGTEVFAAQ